MKDLISRSIFIFLDILIIIISLYLASFIRDSVDVLNIHTINYTEYLLFYPLYIIILTLFAYEGIYTSRYDFWHESRLIIKAIFLSAILVFAYLAMTKSMESYSRLVIGMSFIFIVILIPITKKLLKQFLFSIYLWQKNAEIYGNDTFLIDEIYGNHYLGYVKPKPNEEPSTIFINSKGSDADTLKKLISSQIKAKHEVIYIPLINEYDLTLSHIYELSNTRTNLIIYQNRLKSFYRRCLQQSLNYLLALLSLPILLPLIGLFAFLIKRESKGNVFFAHPRIGQDGKTITILKFRSMYHDADARLEELLARDPLLKAEWERTFKLKNDPRITKIGLFLRKTSLDELPQIFNVLKGEMNFVGPRPIIQEELDKHYLKDAEYYLSVKPGITGLWQVSGRSNTGYDFRVKTDKWYVLNWSLWLDIVILFKTIKVVLKRDGAY